MIVLFWVNALWIAIFIKAMINKQPALSCLFSYLTKSGLCEILILCFLFDVHDVFYVIMDINFSFFLCGHHN